MTHSLRDRRDLVQEGPAALQLRLDSLAAQRHDLWDMNGDVVLADLRTARCPLCIATLPSIRGIDSKAGAA